MRTTPLALALSLAMSGAAFAAPLTYLGELIDGGEPANGRYDLQLTVHSDAALDSALALPITVEDVAVENGRFRVDADFGPLLRAGLPVSPDSAWLEIAVRDAGAKSGFDSLAQREKIALDKAIAACWSSTGDDGSNPAINFLGTLDAQPLELRVNNQRAARFEPTLSTVNLVQGSPANLVNPGVRGAVIAGGGAAVNSDPDFTNESLNRVSGHYGAVGGGYGNTVGLVNEPTTSAFATIGGGERNFATGINATIGGGRQNDATERQSTVAGGGGNEARGAGAAIGGGFSNRIFSTSATISGGDVNRIDLGADDATIGGGNENLISQFGTAATIAGGNENHANGGESTIGGGDSNEANGTGATIAGGRNNFTNQAHTTVAGGFGNSATGQFATVGGGLINQATALTSTVGGGHDNCAGGVSSWAGGEGAVVRGNGCGGVAGAGDDNSFVWSDGTDVIGGGAFQSNGDRQFRVQATGGVLFSTGQLTGVSLSPGSGSWATVSDRNLKANIDAVDVGAILDALVAIPIATWNYTSQAESIRHIGPMAQDFMSAFGVGEDERHITTVDADGVALAAIQGLNAKLEAENAAQRSVIARLEARLDAVEAMQAADSDATVAGR
jgi:hypothetical protein